LKKIAQGFSVKRNTRAAKKPFKISLDAIKMLLNVVIDTMFFGCRQPSKNQLNLPNEAEKSERHIGAGELS
jgi:hypothetical protein